MFERITPAPDGVLAFRAIGEVTHDDYKSVLVPAIEDEIRNNRKVRLVYEIGPAFEGFSVKAALDDAVLGLDHWRDFAKVAVVTDRNWIADAMRIFMPLLPAKAKLFGVDKLHDALDWAAA